MGRFRNIEKGFIKPAFLLLLGVLLCFSSSCKEKVPTVDEKLLGTWQIRLAHIYSVYSFRANGSWTSSERIEGKLNKIIENRGKVVGQWTVEEDENEVGIFWLTMTPTQVELIKTWEVDTPVRFKVLGIDEENLTLELPSGRKVTWKRVRSQKADADKFDEAGAKVKAWPIVVNLARKREHAKFRFLCIDLDFYIEDPDNTAYVKIEKPDGADEPVYHLHPQVREVIIMYFSSLSYKKVKTLDKVKGAVDDLKGLLNPYFNGGLNEIDVVKVVVTTNTDSVTEFEKMYEVALVDEDE